MTEGTLGTIGLNIEYGARNSMCLVEPSSNRRRRARGKLQGDYESDRLGGRTSDDAEPVIPEPPPPPPDSCSESPDQTREHRRVRRNRFKDTGPKAGMERSYSGESSNCNSHEVGYVGLVNQAMTCYLNSLLQALFMTPEFRNALYKWKFDPSQNALPQKCIPYQLQKLFLNLQMSNKSAVETTELTKSFGWESGEVWQQHDIQELCRVMFDALEGEFKNTEQNDLINILYQGNLDFGTLFPGILFYSEANDSGVQVGSGSGTPHLGQSVRGGSGIPDVQGGCSVTVTFPRILDLNSFVQNSESPLDDSVEVIKNDDSSTTDSALDDETNNHISNEAPPAIDTDQEDDEGVDLSNNSANCLENEKNVNQLLARGPYVYDLYSIMIHSGSASGGHYYAYIKDFTRGEWYCFNDQAVTPITSEDIVKTYGGGPYRSNFSYTSMAHSSSTNAYMLMYRQIDKDKNCLAMTTDEFPPHIQVRIFDLGGRE
ncbi:unnamed protein product [Nesidiocoris tenuis]|uniref:Ubiquitin carboxyl-terminal hydrolase n=1 Tax=Nesidiocoris tenuis TaxID=355587 RepID=A0A6H5GUI7_9HEMI|nr:unnamed protein product [Nesidiocoris tenuis]